MTVYGRSADSFVAGNLSFATSAGRRAKHTWSDRYRTRILICDIAVVVLTTVAAHFSLFVLDRVDPDNAPSVIAYTVVSSLVGLTWLLALSAVRSRDPRVVGISVDEYRRIVSATFGVFGAIAIASVIVHGSIARSYFAVALPLGLIALALERWINRRWLARQRRHGRLLSHVIVAGEPEDVRYVIGQIERKRGGVEYHVIGAATADAGSQAGITVRGITVPVISTIEDVAGAVGRVEADAVIVAGPLRGGNQFLKILGWQLEESSTQLIMAPGLTNVAGPRIHFRPVEGLPLMHVELPQYSGARHATKRALDICLSACALIVLAPALLVLALLVVHDSPGTALFRQQRVGRNGRLFTMLKFRSMVEDAETRLAALEMLNQGSGPLFKLHEDPRVTRIGKHLRRFSLDELPQFWNVLVGDMSLVGPRPPLAREVESYDSTVRRRLYIRPGLTGMWQTNGRSLLDWEESVRLDLYYVENWSITGDVILLWRTAKMLFRPSGAY